LRETNRKIGLLSRVRKCFSDYRHPAFIEHELGELLAQRIYSLALGYEDLNDHEELRHDPLLELMAGKRKRGTLFLMLKGRWGCFCGASDKARNFWHD